MAAVDVILLCCYLVLIKVFHLYGWLTMIYLIVVNKVL